MELGKKYHLTHGIGTFLGYESFNAHGDYDGVTDEPQRSDCFSLTYVT